jgi:hypothetical protein
MIPFVQSRNSPARSMRPRLDPLDPGTILQAGPTRWAAPKNSTAGAKKGNR